jgi:hypothetical protein
VKRGVKREVARLVGFTAGYAFVVLLERAVRRIAEAEREAREVQRAAELAAAADELELRRRRQRRCSCSRCEVPA